MRNNIKKIISADCLILKSIFLWANTIYPSDNTNRFMTNADAAPSA